MAPQEGLRNPMETRRPLHTFLRLTPGGDCFLIDDAVILAVGYAGNNSRLRLRIATKRSTYVAPESRLIQEGVQVFQPRIDPRGGREFSIVSRTLHSDMPALYIGEKYRVIYMDSDSDRMVRVVKVESTHPPRTLALSGNIDYWRILKQAQESVEKDYVG